MNKPPLWHRMPVMPKGGLWERDCARMDSMASCVSGWAARLA